MVHSTPPRPVTSARRESPKITFSSVPEVQTQEDLVAIAVAVEREAAARYDNLAQRMDDLGRDDLATLFRALGDEEREHGKGVARWAAGRNLVPAQAVSYAWKAPELSSDEDVADAGGDRLMTAHSALDLAVHNEERAFAFYVQIAAKAATRDIQAAAEDMAREELRHVTVLRLERRRAWRAGRSGKAAETPALPELSEMVSYDAWRQAVLATTAHRFRSLAAGLAEQGEGEASGALRGIASTLPEGPESAAVKAVPPVLLEHALRQASAEVDAFLAVAEKATDEATLRAAQEDAEASILRLAKVSDIHQKQ